MILLYLLLIIASYFIGAIPTGVVLARAFSGKDIRQEGSGNIGATNVTRVLGKKLGALTLVGDLLKGFLPVCVGSYLVSSLNVVCLMGCAAFLGHLFPVYLKFKGGKGVATALGVFLYSVTDSHSYGNYRFCFRGRHMEICLPRLTHCCRIHALVASNYWFPETRGSIEHGLCFINFHKTQSKYTKTLKRDGK